MNLSIFFYALSGAPIRKVENVEKIEITTGLKALLGTQART
jgi:hypothetical protein